jgi:hypothetical protein
MDQTRVGKQIFKNNPEGRGKAGVSISCKFFGGLPRITVMTSAFCTEIEFNLMFSHLNNLI